MAAFNWILIDAACPACARSALVRCQTHVASSYDGDASRRFHDREYRLGQRMAWSQPGDPRHDEWRQEYGAADSLAEEPCYSDCTACGAELLVVIRFRDLVPAETLSISPASSAGGQP